MQANDALFRPPWEDADAAPRRARHDATLPRRCCSRSLAAQDVAAPPLRSPGRSSAARFLDHNLRDELLDLLLSAAVWFCILGVSVWILRPAEHLAV